MKHHAQSSSLSMMIGLDAKKGTVMTPLLVATTALSTTLAAHAAIFFASFSLAKKGEYFRKVEPNQAHAVMRGKRLVKFLMNRPGYHVNDPNLPGYETAEELKDRLGDKFDCEADYAIVPDKPGVSYSPYKDSRFLWKLCARYGNWWYGFVPLGYEIYTYHMSFFEYRKTQGQPGEQPKEILVLRDTRNERPSDHDRVAPTTYTIVVLNAETFDNAQADLFFDVTVETSNIKTALFGFDRSDWITPFTADFVSCMLQLAARNTYEEITKQVGKAAKAADKTGSDASEDSFTRAGLGLNTDLASKPGVGAPHHYGKRIVSVALHDVTLAGDTAQREELTKALLAGAIARRNAEALLITAASKRDAMNMETEALINRARGPLEAELAAAAQHPDQYRLKQLAGAFPGLRTLVQGGGADQRTADILAAFLPNLERSTGEPKGEKGEKKEGSP